MKAVRRSAAGRTHEVTVAPEASTKVTRLLHAVRGGEKQARDELFTLVYDELRRLAHSKMRNEKPGQTLQTTALVNEAYLRLAGDADSSWENRAHFFGAAGQAMRRILIERARRRGAIKRGGDQQRVTYGEDRIASEATPDPLELDQALGRLEEQDARKAAVVNLHYFLGFTVDETAAMLGVSPRTVDKDWRLARAWLRRELTRE